MLLHENSIDAFGLYETRLDNKVTDSNASIAGYRDFSNDRDLNGGGLAICIKEDFPELSVRLKSDALGLLVLELAPKHSKYFYLACWYRPPTSGIDICNMLEAEQDSINKRTCIVHHIALIQNSATYNTEAIIIEKTPRVTSSVDTLHFIPLLSNGVLVSD